MANKVKYGLKNVYFALQTETEGVYSYETPVAQKGAKSLSMDAVGEATPFYADDVVYFRADGNSGYSGNLEVALADEWFRTHILNERKDTNGVLVEVADGAEAPKFAMLFEFAGDEKAIRHVLYNCTASRAGLSGQTKEEKIDPQTESFAISCTPRDDGLVKAKSSDDTTSAVYTGWYGSVYEPVITDAAAETGTGSTGSTGSGT